MLPALLKTFFELIGLQPVTKKAIWEESEEPAFLSANLNKRMEPLKSQSFNLRNLSSHGYFK
jgi:hypothetical protein